MLLTGRLCLEAVSPAAPPALWPSLAQPGLAGALRTLSPLLPLLIVLFAVTRVLAAAGPTPMAGELLAALLTAPSSLSVTLALATLLLTALAHPTVLSALSTLALLIALSTLLSLAVLTGELLAALLAAALLLVVLLPAAA